MGYLIAGLLLWCLVHLIPSLLPGLRSTLIDKLGAPPYKGLFSLGIVAAISLIVIGWQNTPVEQLYPAPAWGRQACLFLMPIALLFFISGRKPNNIRLFVRHPQLCGVVLIAVAHLMANSDNRSLLLFGTLAAWAILEMIFINRRDGRWQKPQRFPLKADLISLLIAAIVTTVFVFLHPYLFGVALN
jgi:uncharacterized membrane protein